MAFVLFNMRNNPVFLAKEENHINFYRGDLAIIKSEGRLKEVSEEDYKSLVAGEKNAKLTDGNVVLSDQTESLNFSQSDFEVIKNFLLEDINRFIRRATAKLAKSEWSSLKTNLTEFQTALQNLDVSTISYPVSTSFYRYWYTNQATEPFALCYFPK